MLYCVGIITHGESYHHTGNGAVVLLCAYADDERDAESEEENRPGSLLPLDARYVRSGRVHG